MPDLLKIPSSMASMILEQVGKALIYRLVSVPQPQKGQVLLKILACIVCRTGLHIVDSELAYPSWPLILGHEIIGRIVRNGMGTAHYPERF